MFFDHPLVLYRIHKSYKWMRQERIHERGGRKLFEEGAAYFQGLDNYTIDQARARLLLQAARSAGCKLAMIDYRMEEENLTCTFFTVFFCSNVTSTSHIGTQSTGTFNIRYWCWS